MVIIHGNDDVTVCMGSENQSSVTDEKLSFSCPKIIIFTDHYNNIIVKSTITLARIIVRLWYVFYA